jgi:hypothetical protein
MLTFCNSYVLWLLRFVQLRLVTVMLSDVYVRSGDARFSSSTNQLITWSIWWDIQYIDLNMNYVNFFLFIFKFVFQSLTRFNARIYSNAPKSEKNFGGTGIYLVAI